MRREIIYLIFGMTLVTYLPRVLPFIVPINKNNNPTINRFLSYIPCTALGALIIPGVLDSIPGKPLVSIIGILTTATFAWIKGGIIIPVLGGVFITFLMLLLGIQ